LACGGEAIYQVTHAFRGAERGKLHNPEFAIVEWYRRGDSMNDGIQLLDELCHALLGRDMAERVSYAQAFRDHLGIDPHRDRTSKLISAARSCNLVSPTCATGAERDDVLNLLLAERVQPHLGRGRPTIVYDYPATQAALARTRGEDPPVAERFELFVDGVELANGYHELVDPEELRRRNRAVNAQRQVDGKPPYPEQSHLLRAMDHGLPSCTGVALGFDRVVMLGAGGTTLEDVLTFPIDRA